MSAGQSHWVCDCVPDLGPPHCHYCSELAGIEVAFDHCPAHTPSPANQVLAEREEERA